MDKMSMHRIGIQVTRFSSRLEFAQLLHGVRNVRAVLVLQDLGCGLDVLHLPLPEANGVDQLTQPFITRAFTCNKKI